MALLICLALNKKEENKTEGLKKKKITYIQKKAQKWKPKRTFDEKFQ